MRHSLFILAAAALVLSACRKEDTTSRDNPGPWQYEAYADCSIHPGDDFFRYCAGRGLDGAGSDTWTPYAIWKKQQTDFEGCFLSDEDNNPVEIIRKLSSLKKRLADGNCRESAIDRILERIGSMRVLTSTRDFPEMLASEAMAGHTLVSLQPLASPGRKLTISVLSNITMPVDDLSKDDILTLGMDYDDYLKKLDLADQAVAYFSRERPDGAEKLTGFNLRDADECRRFMDMKEKLKKSCTSGTRAGMSAFERFSAAFGSPEAEFIPLNAADTHDFEMMDKMSEEMLEPLNALLWCRALAEEYSYIRDSYMILPMFMTILVPTLMVNASHEFCDRYVKEGDMKRNLEVFEELRSTMKENILELDWMSGTTKDNAIRKLDAMICHTGILDWAKYEATMTDDRDFCSAMIALRAEFVKKSVASCTDTGNPEPILATLCMTPFNGQPAYQANSFYIPYANLMYILPSTSILLDMNRDFPFITPVIAHEMCHGFDSNGALYDANGDFKDWWTIEDKLRFKSKQAQLSSIFSQYVATGTTFCDGEKTINENMADLGGVETAYNAAMKRLTEKYSGEALAEMERRFFKTYAVLWAKYLTEEEKEKMARDDDHSINELRVNGILNNIDAWYDAFDVNGGRKFYLAPDQRVHLFTN